MAQSQANDITRLIEEAEKTIKDGAYVVVGLGVLGFQQAQVRRRELAKRLASERDTVASQLEDTSQRVGVQLGGLGDRLAANAEARREQLSGLAQTVDERFAPARRQLDRRFDAIEETLPPGARSMLDSARHAASVPEARIRRAIGLD